MNRVRMQPNGIRLRSIVAALLVVGSATPTIAAEVRLPKANERWIEVRTAHFRFFSNAGLSATRRVALDLEELRAVLAHLNSFELRSPVPTLIYVFKDERSFTPYRPLYQGRPAALSGYFLGHPLANYIAIAADSRDASTVVFHEYVHYVSANNLWWIPVWLDEGLAQLYQTFSVTGDTVSIGLPIESHLRRLGGRTLIPLSELLAVDHESPLYNEEDRKSTFYAQSWALTHDLVLGSPERRRQLGRYIALVRDGTPESEAFTSAFGSDFEALEAEVRAHIRGPRIPIIRFKATIDLDTSLDVREMSPADVLYRLGDLLAVQEPERDEAVEYFEAALESDPGHGPSLTALALAAERRLDWEAAAAAYERAARARPDDAIVLFQWGRFLTRHHGSTEQAVAVLRRSVELDPSLAPAWLELASASTDRGDDPDGALAAARTAHRLLPSNVEAANIVLRLELRLDHRQEAVAVIGASFAGDRIRSAEAWMTVLQHDLMRARDLMLAGDFEAAEARLELAEAGLGRAARPEIIREGIDDTRRSILEHEATRTYDRAARLYADGDSGGARELLVRVLAELPPDGSLVWSCRSLLEVIDHPERFRSLPPKEVSPTGDEIAQLNRLLAAGSFEAAIEFLREVRGHTPEARRAWVDDKIGELQWTLDYNRSVDLYNRAVDLYNARRYDQAAEVLEELIAAMPDGPYAGSARTLLEDALRAGERR